jgi:hypothetical protein
MRHVTIHSTPNPDALPPGMDALRDAILDLERFRAEQGKAQAAVRRLSDSRRQAADDDRQATMKAIREGKDDPGPRITTALEVRIAQERNRADAAAMLVAEAEMAVMAALKAHAAEYDAVVDRMADEARAALTASLGPVRAAVDTLNAAYGLRDFLDGAADPTTTVLRAGRGTLRVNGLSRVKGESYAVGTVLDGLAALAEPEPEPETEPDGAPLAPRVGEGVWVSPNGR